MQIVSWNVKTYFLGKKSILKALSAEITNQHAKH